MRKLGIAIGLFGGLLVGFVAHEIIAGVALSGTGQFPDSLPLALLVGYLTRCSGSSVWWWRWPSTAGRAAGTSPHDHTTRQRAAFPQGLSRARRGGRTRADAPLVRGRPQWARQQQLAAQRGHPAAQRGSVTRAVPRAAAGAAGAATGAPRRRYRLLRDHPAGRSDRGRTPPESDGYPTDLVTPVGGWDGGAGGHGGTVTAGTREYVYPLPRTRGHDDDGQLRSRLTAATAQAIP